MSKNGLNIFVVFMRDALRAARVLKKGSISSSRFTQDALRGIPCLKTGRFLFTRDALMGIPCLKTGRFLFLRRSHKSAH